MRFGIKLEELNLTLSIKSEEITPPLDPIRVDGPESVSGAVVFSSGRCDDVDVETRRLHV